MAHLRGKGGRGKVNLKKIPGRHADPDRGILKRTAGRPGTTSGAASLSKKPSCKEFRCPQATESRKTPLFPGGGPPGNLTPQTGAPSLAGGGAPPVLPPCQPTPPTSPRHPPPPIAAPAPFFFALGAQRGLLGVEAVLRLVKDLLGVGLKDLGGDLLPRWAGRQCCTMHPGLVRAIIRRSLT